MIVLPVIFGIKQECCDFLRHSNFKKLLNFKDFILFLKYIYYQFLTKQNWIKQLLTLFLDACGLQHKGKKNKLNNLVTTFFIINVSEILETFALL